MTKSNGPYANPWWHHSNWRENRFLRDVESYQLSVVRDEGLDRHLKFKRTDAQPIHIVTWDGYLAIPALKEHGYFGNGSTCSSSFALPVTPLIGTTTKTGASVSIPSIGTKSLSL
jgi:hypothetical protein